MDASDEITSPLTSVAPDVWQVRAPAMKMPGGFRMPIASTLVRLPDRSLLLYSPVPLSADAVAAISAQGEVAHIVAPSLWHHLYAKAAREQFPRAMLHGAPGLAAKRTDLTFDRELPTIDPAWGGVLSAVVIGGAPKLNEAVLFHRPSETLLCADLAFNLSRPANMMSRIVFAMTGVGGGKLAQSRVWKLAVKDRAAARASLDEVLGWSIQRIAPVHGDPIAIDQAELARVMTRAYGGLPQPLLATAAGNP
jgi:hypothetical protein